MIIYAGLLYVVLSSIYTFSYAAAMWKEKNRLASIGAVFVVFLAMALSLFVFLRT